MEEEEKNYWKEASFYTITVFDISNLLMSAYDNKKKDINRLLMSLRLVFTVVNLVSNLISQLHSRRDFYTVTFLSKKYFM